MTHIAILSVLRGIGQVMFQCNALSGLVMLTGMFIGSWQLALLALMGNIISTATAYIAHYDRKAIADGIFGFNGTLVGIAMGVFLHINIGTLIIMALASALSTWITRLFQRQAKLAGYTAPFIIATWLMILFCRYVMPSELLISMPPPPDDCISMTTAIGFGIGQVMFQGNTPLSGLFFLIAILLNSRINAAHTLFGTLLSIPIALLLNADVTAVNAGLLCYNGVLCAIAIGDKSLSKILMAAFSIALSTVIQYFGIKFGIITLTAPFVLATWTTIFINAKMKTITLPKS